MNHTTDSPLDPDLSEQGDVLAWALKAVAAAVALAAAAGYVIGACR